MDKIVNNVVVSVVMCCYNEQRYIREAIESVLSQTFGDFEFIIWNDGSTDKTEEIIKSYNDNRIRYFYHQNTGVGEALRLACQQVKGKYIARIDADDICMPERFRKQVAYLEAHPDCVLCSSAYYYIDENGIATGRRFPASWNFIMKRQLNSIAHPATMFRTASYIKAGGYTPLRSGQDKIMWSKLMSLGKFINLQEPLIKYRMLSSSITRSFPADSEYGQIIRILRDKMCNDEKVVGDDVMLYNTVYVIAKKLPSINRSPASFYHYTIEERVFNISKKLFNDKIANQIVYGMKNLYLFPIVLLHKTH